MTAPGCGPAGRRIDTTLSNGRAATMERRKIMLGTTLSILIPAVVIAYGVWLAVRMIRNRSTGKCGNCAGCPYAGGCHSVRDCRLEKDQPEHKQQQEAPKDD